MPIIRGDNITYGVVNQTLITGSPVLSGSTFHHYGQPFTSTTELEFPTVADGYVSDIRAQFGLGDNQLPLGSGHMRHLLKIQTPPDPYTGTKISKVLLNTNIYGSLSYHTGEDRNCEIYHLANMYETRYSSKLFPKQVLYAIAGAGTDTTVNMCHMDNNWGGNYTHKLYKNSDSVGVDIYTYVCFEEPVNGIAIEVKQGILDIDSGDISDYEMSYYRAGCWEQIETKSTISYGISNETDKMMKSG